MVKCRKCGQYALDERDPSCVLIPSPWECPKGGKHEFSELGQDGPHGVSISQLLDGTIPEPSHRLEWGEDIPAAVMAALRRGETAMLHGADGEPHSVVLMDYFGTIRERRLREE